MSDGALRVNALCAILSSLLLVVALLQAASAVAQATPNLVGALSRKVHGAAGTFDLPLSLDADEPDDRTAAGPAQTVVFVVRQAGDERHRGR